MPIPATVIGSSLGPKVGHDGWQGNDEERAGGEAPQGPPEDERVEARGEGHDDRPGDEDDLQDDQQRP